MKNPQDRVAAQYMEDKGYVAATPIDIQSLEGRPCWYFLYDLPEGRLELEVNWNEGGSEWETTVTSFRLVS